MSTAPTQRRRSRTTTSTRAGSSLRTCTCEYCCLAPACLRVGPRVRCRQGWLGSGTAGPCPQPAGWGIPPAACRGALPGRLPGSGRGWGALAPAVAGQAPSLELVTLLILPEGPIALKFKLPSPSPYTQLRNRPNWD